MQTLLNELFRYEDGEVYRKEPWRKSNDITKPAGYKEVSGYTSLHFKGNIRTRLHVVVWIMHNGNIPEGYKIDHIDRNKADSRIENLRLATHRENIINSEVRPTNSLGVKGIHAITLKSGRVVYRTQVSDRGNYYSKSGFETIESAQEYVETLRAELHGEYVCNA